MYAYFFNHALKFLQVEKGLGPSARIAQKRGGVVERHHFDPVRFVPRAVINRNLEIRTDNAHCGNAPQADNYFRSYKRRLLAQPFDTGLLLRIKGVPVLGGTAFNYIRNKNISAIKVDNGKHIVEQLACPAYKGLTREVLLLPGALSYEKHLRLGVAGPENYIGSRLAKGAVCAIKTLVF
jgi:hypothetical protein